MTHEEYIKSMALGTITAVENTLEGISPELMDDTITQEDYDDVIFALAKLKIKLLEDLLND